MPITESDAVNYGNLALAAHREDRLDDALRNYRLFLHQNPSSSEGWLGLGMLLHMKLRDPLSAIHCYETSIALAPQPGLAELHLGTLLCEMDRQDEAIRHLERYRAAEPRHDPSVYADLACAYARLGRLSEAAGIAARYRAAAPCDHFAPYLAAWVAAMQADPESALHHVTDAVALDPLWPVPLALRGMVLSTLGRQDEARRTLQEMVAIQGGLLATGASAQSRCDAHLRWQAIRADAKRELGIAAHVPANFVMLHGGLGDQFLICSILPHFRAAHAPVPLVVFHNPRAQWRSLFPGAADLFVKLAPETIAQMNICNRFFPDHPYTNFFPWLGPLVSLFTLPQITKFNFALPQTVRPCEPVIADDARRSGQDLFARLGGRNGRSVLISPLSNSNPMADDAWWRALVGTLDAAGFVVFQNMANLWNTDRPAPLAPAIPVELPPEQVVPFCEACGHFIGIRSGLCDLLGYARARLKAIHVVSRYAKNPRYPLSIWLDGRCGYALGRCFETGRWQDIDIARDAAFDTAVIADWLSEPALIAASA